MTKHRLLTGSLLCGLAAGCTYNIELERPTDEAQDTAPTTMGAVMTGQASARPAQAAGDRVPAAESAAAHPMPTGPTTSAPPRAGKPAASPPPAPPPPSAGPAVCKDRIVSRREPCSDDPDPCALNSGFAGDEYCLRPPPEGEGIQIHFGPKSYDDPAEVEQYWLVPGDERNSSVLAQVPLAETRYWSRITVHARPTAHHWVSMRSPAPGLERFYEDDTACGSTELAPGGWGSGQNLIYDNPPLGIPAPENEGIGYRISGGSTACLNVHAYNFTDSPQLRELWVNLYFLDEAHVTQQTGTISLRGALGLELPPGERRELTYSAQFTGDGRVLQLSGHRSKWTPRFAAWLNDEHVYDSHGWVEAITFNYDSVTKNPPIDGEQDGATSGVLPFRAGDTLRFTCSIVNESDVTLKWGNELEGGEVCDLWGATVGASLSASFQ